MSIICWKKFTCLCPFHTQSTLVLIIFDITILITSFITFYFFIPQKDTFHYYSAHKTNSINTIKMTWTCTNIIIVNRDFKMTCLVGGDDTMQIQSNVIFYITLNNIITSIVWLVQITCKSHCYQILVRTGDFKITLPYLTFFINCSSLQFWIVSWYYALLLQYDLKEVILIQLKKWQ